MSSTLLYGRFILDNGRLNQHRRAQIGFLSWCIPMLACITWISINRTQFVKNTPLPAYDWTDKGWANGESCLTSLSFRLASAPRGRWLTCNSLPPLPFSPMRRLLGPVCKFYCLVKQANTTTAR